MLSGGLSPDGAAELSLSKMASKYPNNMAAIVVVNADGEFGLLNILLIKNNWN